MTPRARRAWFAAGAVIALLVAAPAALEAKKVVSQDPAFCGRCHQMDGPVRRWEQSAHADVTCVACHPGSLATDLRHVWLALVARVDEVTHPAVVDEGACIGCHVDGGQADWPAVARTAGHRVHHRDRRIRCVTCHASEMHVARPPLDQCATCHEQALHLAGMAGKVHCLDCHRFLADQPELAATADTCRGCHRSADAAPGAPPRIGVHGTADCMACHAPHAPPPDPDRTCAACHAERPAAHTPRQAACTDCHLPHRPARAATRACEDCHRVRDREHRVPAHRSCASCHRGHRAVPVPEGRCLDCHRDLADWHASTGCIGCHRFR